MNILLGIIMGGLFGYALYFVRASSSKKIISMLSLQNLILMKIIVFAIGLSSVLLFFANLIGIFDISHISIKSANLGVVVGGLIFGLGFALAGTCPGTCVAASSSGGKKKAVYAILGGLMGAFLFSLMYGWFKSLGLYSTMDLGKLTLFNISDKYPAVFNIGFVGLLFTGILFMVIGYFLPEKPFVKN